MYDTPKPTSSGTSTYAVNGGTAALHTSLPSDQSRAEIAGLLTDQEKLTHSLLEQIDLLESRLMPVLALAPPATMGAPDPSSSVPVAACISENSARIRRALQRIDDVRSRLAL